MNITESVSPGSHISMARPTPLPGRRRVCLLGYARLCVYTGIGKWGKGGAIAEKAGSKAYRRTTERIAVVRCKTKSRASWGGDGSKAGIVHRQEEFLFPD